MKNYPDEGYLNNRLRDTVVFINNEPGIVQVIERGRVHYFSLSSGAERVDDIDNMDITPPALGFMNYDGRALYVSRKPMRRDWRQGLRANNLCVEKGSNFSMNLRSLTKTLLNKYPSVHKCIDAVHNKSYRSMAFSRNFAIKRNRGANHTLIYQGDNKVGVVNDFTSSTCDIQLDDKCSFLQEQFSQELAYEH